MAELTESGELVGGQALADPSTTRTIRQRGGQPAVTDGPFVESKEQFAGYLVVDCESLERAIEIAATLARRPLRRRHGGAGVHGRCRDGDVSRPMQVVGSDAGPWGGVEHLLREAGAAGARRAGPPLRPVRRLRGRRPGGAAGRRGAVARAGRAGRIRAAGCITVATAG